MNTTTYGVDIAKNVFQVHWVDAATGEIGRKKLARAKVAEFFAQRPPTRVALEACGGAHHWARILQAQGHAVQLLPAHQVRAFVTGNKDDQADARAIWLAAQHSDLRRVPIKSCDQQTVLSLHRMRSHWISVRTATVNAMRGLLYEFGVVLPKSRRAALKVLAEQRARIDDALPVMMVRLLDTQLEALRDIERQLQATEDEIGGVQQASDAARRLRQVPGIGLLGATALAAELGDATGWRNGRQFAACLGLAPRHTGSGGRVRIGGISKRGNPYLRTLLISGARAVASRAHPAPWIVQLKARRPFNIVVVALAHKLARMAWAIVAHQRRYDAQWRATPLAPATVGSMPRA